MVPVLALMEEAVMYRTLVFGLLAVAASAPGCRKQSGDRIERSGEPEFVLSRVNDTEMEAAMRRAHETLPQFATALAGERHGKKLFAIRRPTRTARRLSTSGSATCWNRGKDSRPP
jgi:hypothetical protein